MFVFVYSDGGKEIAFAFNPLKEGKAKKSLSEPIAR